MVGGESEVGAVPGPAPSGVKRKRTPRVISSQVDALLSCLEVRPYLHSRKFTGLQGRENFDAGWKEVAAELNQLPNGSIKTPEQWMTVWRDFKSRACSKAARLRKERVQTGNRAITTAPLTEVDRRIVSLIGTEYTFGTECPDSMPEEYTIQCAMETETSVSEVINLPQNQYSELECLEVENPVPVDTEAPSGSRTTVNVMSRSPLPLPPEQQIERSIESPEPQITASRTSHSAPNVQHGRSARNRNLTPRRSVDEQFSSARRDFLAVAESNAKSMRILATAATLQAEALATFAEAAKEQSETGKKIAEALIKISEKF